MKKKISCLEINLKQNNNIFLLYNEKSEIFIPIFYFIKMLIKQLCDFENIINDDKLNQIYKQNFKIIKYSKFINHNDFNIIKENLNTIPQNFIDINFFLNEKNYIKNVIQNILIKLDYNKYNRFKLDCIYDNMIRYVLTESFKYFSLNNININKKFIRYGFGNLFVPYYLKIKTDNNVSANIINNKITSKFYSKNIIIQNNISYLNDDYYIKILNIEYNKTYTITKKLLQFMFDFNILMLQNICLFNNNINNLIFLGTNIVDDNIYYNVKENKIEYIHKDNDKKQNNYINKIYYPSCICL